MNAYVRTSNLAAYQSAAAHGGVAASDPHRLIVMLMDGALERIATARGCMQRGETSEKVRLLNRTLSIVAELRGSLDMSAGGQIAANLGDLYDYIGRRLLSGLANNQVDALDEASNLLNELRGAWVTIPADARARQVSR
jgi:flagellar protein FliS